jgi:hypothetical protein
MIVMPANNSKWQVHYWQGRHGGLGHLYSPGSQRGPYPHLPYALDNGAFPAFTKGVEWDEMAWLALLGWASAQDIKPAWVLVPDVVADRVATIERWEEYAPLTKRVLPGVALAFAVQDGMRVDDVPQSADVVFVGGTTDWKWATAGMWCQHFSRVHIGRVNSYRRLMDAASCGAESTDGTGWFRGDKQQLRGLERFLLEQSANAGRSPSAPASMVAAFTRRGINSGSPAGDRINEAQASLFGSGAVVCEGGLCDEIDL